MLSLLSRSTRCIARSRFSLDCCVRHLSFSFAGARKLDDIVKKDLLEDKTAAQVSDIWYSYHEERENMHGIIMSGSNGKDILLRAAKWCVL